MKYNIYVQNQLVDVVEAPNTGIAIANATQKLQNGEIQYDNSKPQDLKVEPVKDWLCFLKDN